jgi:TonB C terminal
VNIGADRQVAGYSIVRQSGNATFDAAVKASMDTNVGQQLPPPPPLYPDLLNTTVHPVFQGKCDQ